MASKIGVYFDVQNIGGGLDVEALAEQVRSKWSDLTPVVKVLPMLSVAEDEVRADIEANGLDGVLFCGASPRDEATPWQLPVQVEHVNLREQCVLAYKNPDGSAVSGAAPALLTQMATDYVNMGVVKLQKSNMPESAAIEGIKRILVIGGGWTGLTAAQEAAKRGLTTILSPQIPYYINRRQSKDVWEPRSQGWGTETVEAVYNYVPMKNVAENLQEKYMGVQANFWTEWVENTPKLQYLLLPRLAAVAEAGWTPQAERSYPDFLKRLQQEPSYYDMKGMNYGKHVFK